MTANETHNIIQSEITKNFGIKLGHSSFEVKKLTEKAVQILNIDGSPDKVYPIWVPVSALTVKTVNLKKHSFVEFNFKNWFIEKMQFEKSWKRVALGLTCY